MDSTVELTFRYLQSDYVQAMRSHYASRLRIRFDIAVVLLVALAGVYNWRSGPRWLGVALIVISVAFALLLVAAFTIIPIVAFRLEPKFRDEYALTFSPEGIHFRTAHIDSKLQWSIYSRALVDTRSYVLYHGTRSFTVIPTRVFQDSEQRKAFEQLLTRNIPEITGKNT